MRGFTLIELLLVITILGVVAGLSVPFLQTFQTSSDFQVYLSDMQAALRRAQSQAADGFRDDDWGVYFNDAAQTFTLFKGSDFVSRDQSFDQDFQYPQIFSLTTDFSNQTVYFKSTGEPNASGTITFLGPNSGQTGTLRVTAAGRIDLER